MELPEGFERKEYIEIWYGDLGRVSKEHFGGEMDMAVVLDFPSQDSYEKVTVPSDRDWAYDWNNPAIEESTELIAKVREELAEGVTRKTVDTTVTAEAILDLLHEDGIIPAGEYLITVWW